MKLSRTKVVAAEDKSSRPTEEAGQESPGAGDTESYERWRTQFAAERLRVLYYLGLIANPVFIAADLLLHRESLSSLLAIRAVLELGLLVCFVGMLRKLPLLKPNTLLILWVLIGNVCISQMTVVLGGFTSQYHNGVKLVLLAAAVIVPVSWPSHLASQLGSLVYYFGVNLLRPMTDADLNAAIGSTFFLIWTCVALLFSVYLYEGLQRAEYYARVSERRTRQELEASNKKLLELDRLKSEFFANVSHELRTPLTLSLGGYKTLQKAPLPSECQEVVASGLRNTTRLLYLINELLDLAKFDSGRAALRKRPMDLAQLVREVAANFETDPRRRVHLTGGDEPMVIEADQRPLRKVLYNLLSNAFKFSDPTRGEVWIALNRNDGMVQVEVRDNGIGIPRTHLERIFDRFTQVEGSATRRYEGTGIGLALVKEIVSLHRGTVTAESEVGRGSTFRVVLPVGRVDSQDRPYREEEDAEQLASSEQAFETDGEAGPVETALPGDSPLLLVAEDNADMRAYLVRLLGKHYRVELARDGAEGVRKAKEFHPALILTDVMMPGMSGYELLKAVRREAAIQAVPVIFLTARAGAEARVESLEAGADDYLCKPFNEDELLARIKNQLRLHAQERTLETQAVELRRVNSELESLNEKLRDLDQRKSEFVSIVSHELRTPMSAIGGFVENMLEGLGGSLTEKQRYYLQRMKVNVDRLTRMVNELLDLARIEAGTTELHIEPIRIQEFVNTLIEGLQPMVREKSLALRASHAPEFTRVHGDRDKLTQIFTNLIHNAMKFTPAGGEVRVEVQPGGDGFVQVCVADTGCGIQASEIDKVFKRFYRGGSVSPEGRGAGLGLAIVKHLVELQRGRIWVESRPGEGSRFFFTLPQAPPG